MKKRFLACLCSRVLLLALWTVDQCITSGIDAPDNICNRGQVLTFLCRVAGSAESGVATGMTATTFEPNNACTRGQIVTFMYRALAMNK